jgi:hypothetical protein
MIGIRSIALILAALMAAMPCSAAPIAQVSCTYENFPKDRLKDFGMSLVDSNQQRPADLDPLYNKAENACIAEYGWEQARIDLAGRYFIARVTREALMRLFQDNFIDYRKIDRAYGDIKGRISSKPEDVGQNTQMINMALQKQGFLIDSEDIRDASFTYIALFNAQDLALAQFAQFNDAQE